MNTILIILGKLISNFSSTFNLGSGSTWPGHIALSLDKNFISKLQKNSNLKVIFIAGTNGKTTTSKILTTILRENNFRVFQNKSGANLLNGVASSLLLHSNLAGKIDYDFAVFEIDENTLPKILEQITPFAIIVLNLFRDQLDRYGELDSIAKKWHEAFKKLNKETSLILNADDPLISYLSHGIKSKTLFIGLKNSKSKNEIEESADSIYCPKCQTKLNYSSIFYSHLGIWMCPNCHLQRPHPDLSDSFFPLLGTYNNYNTLAAVLISQVIDIDHKVINSALHKVIPAFGRQEKLNIDGKNVEIYLSKNPTSMNESLQTVIQKEKNPNILFVLNDQTPDGRDVSWIWDINFELYIDKFKSVFISGDRVYDMGLRIEYAQSQNSKFNTQNYNSKFKMFEELKESINTALNSINQNETLYILPTYSAMLEVRKILTGKKIL